jgi:chemotaxis protein CheD
MTASITATLVSAAHALRPTAFLQAGHLLVSNKPLSVVTILGSCVSVCLWDLQTGIGGINHYLLPYSAPDAMSGPRYGDTAIRMLIDKILALGAEKTRLRASVFGGATVLALSDNGRTSLGSRNVEIALRMLEQERISIDQCEIEGTRGRKVTFHTDTGYVSTKTI